MVSGLSTENLLSAILEALAEPTVSYIGLGYDSTVSLNTGNSHNKIFPHTLHNSLNTDDRTSKKLINCTYVCLMCTFSVLYNSEPDPRFPILSEFMRTRALVGPH